VWAFFTAVYSASTGLLNNANLWCWIAPLPQGCKDSYRYGDEANCVRGDNWWIYRWAVSVVSQGNFVIVFERVLIPE